MRVSRNTRSAEPEHRELVRIESFPELSHEPPEQSSELSAIADAPPRERKRDTRSRKLGLQPRTARGDQ
jgi:hypothetical protein